jgi:small subunit ribosomal protein S14
MAKKSVVLRNEKRKKMVQHQAPLRKELKSKALDFSLSDEERQEARMKLQNLPRNGARVRVRNRCQITGRGRGVYRKLMVSRIIFREYAHCGFIPGVTKASW